MSLRPALACLLLAAWLPAGAADPWRKPGGASELLSAEQAFPLQAVRRVPGGLQLDWSIAPGYYLYRQRLAIEPVGSGTPLAAPELPKGEPLHDEHFGAVEVYRAALSARLHAASGQPLPARLRLRWQGCADTGVCLPPVSREIDVPSP